MWSGEAQQPESPKQLNPEQLHHLLNKLSSDEQKELTEMMRSCTTEVTMTRGLPITAAILGSLYYARKRLPEKNHFGPKGWPFYAIMGIASLTATNVLFMGMCRDRVQPRIRQLWQKYNMDASQTNYDEIRRRNRQGIQQNIPKPANYQTQPVTPRPESNDQFNYDPYSIAYQPIDGGMKTENKSAYDFDMTSSSQGFDSPKPSRPPPATFLYGDDGGYMSGTPSGSSNRNKPDFS